MVDGVNCVPTHDHFNSPLLFGGEPSCGDGFIRVHIAAIDESAGEGNRDAPPHQVYLGFEIVIELHLLSHNDLSLLDFLQQVLNIRVLLDDLSCFVHIGSDLDRITGCGEDDFVLYGCARQQQEHFRFDICILYKRVGLNSIAYTISLHKFLYSFFCSSTAL